MTLMWDNLIEVGFEQEDDACDGIVIIGNGPLLEVRPYWKRGVKGFDELMMARWNIFDRIDSYFSTPIPSQLIPKTLDELQWILKKLGINSVS